MADFPFHFLLSSERSGSNLITQMLNAHPDVCGPTPSHAFRLFAGNRYRYGPLEDDANWANLCEDLVSVFDSMLGVWLSRPQSADLQQGYPRSLAALLRAVYEQEARLAGKHVLFVKENQPYLFLPFCQANFPEARFVLLVRDPRDVCLSWRRSPNHPGGVTRAVNQWIEDQTQHLRIYSCLLDTGRGLLVRYEDLIQDAPFQSERICDFLGLAYSPATLDFHKETLTEVNARRVRNWSNLGKPILPDNHRKFLSVFTKEEIDYIEARCGELMDTFGYERAGGLPTSDVSVLEQFVSSADAEHETEALEAPEEDVRVRRLAAIQRVLKRQPRIW